MSVMPDFAQQADENLYDDALKTYKKTFHSSDGGVSRSDWEALWQAADFTWNGLAKKDLPFKRWSPKGRILELIRARDGNDEQAPVASLQDYWRWSIGLDGPERLLTDEELTELGLLLDIGGEKYHFAHAPEKTSNEAFTVQIAARAQLASSHRKTDAERSLIPLLLHGANIIVSQLGALPVGTKVDAYHSSWSEPNQNWENNDITAAFGAFHAPYSCFRNVDFHKSSFAGTAVFSFSLFDAQGVILGCEFSESAKFDYITNTRWKFRSNDFHNHADFNFFVGSGWTDFGANNFNSFAWFVGAKFKEGADFTHSAFGKTASFNNSVFGGNASFQGCSFQGGCQFLQVPFHAAARFDNSTFAGRTLFEESNFEDDVSFKASTFGGEILFKNTIWPNIPIDNAFSNCVFEGQVDFSAEDFSQFSALHNVTFGKIPMFSDKDSGSTWADLAKVAMNRTKRQVALEKRTRDSEQTSSISKDSRWSSLSGGFRTMKLLSARMGDHVSEQTFYRYEIKSRVKRPKTSSWERFLTRLYGLSSDYGNSTFRPFLGLFVLLMSFSVVYLALGIATTLDAQNAMNVREASWQAWDFSWNNMFRPLSALAIQSGELSNSDRLVSELLFGEHPAVSAGVRLLATLQSLLSVVLAFLFALAVRRQFRID